MKEKKSQRTLLEHSEVKIKLLKIYLQRYFNILIRSKYVSSINIYDLFCGEGIYENGGKGSPIVILEILKDLFNSGNKDFLNFKNIHCHFNDLNSKKIENLKKEIRTRSLSIPQIKSLRYNDKDYKKVVIELIETLSKSTKDQKFFIFIDPYGYKDINIEEIVGLMKSRNSEVLLFLPTQFMFRFEKKGTPTSLKRFIEQIVPEEEWPKSETGIDFIEKLKDGIRQNIHKEGFVDTFIITRDTNQFFCLFFFTSHIYGFEKMLEAKWQIDEDYGRGWALDQATDLFSLAKKNPATEKLEQILKSLLTVSFHTNRELYEITLRNGFLPKHSNQILKKLYMDGRLEIEPASNAKVKKGSFYVNYNNYKTSYSRIKIKLK